MVSMPDVAAIRFGYGLSPGVVPPPGAASLMRQLVDAEPVPEALAGMRSPERILAFIREVQGQKDNPEAQMAARLKLTAARTEEQHTYVTAVVESPSPFFERLVAFWTNHFTVSAKVPLAGWVGPYQVEAIRPHVKGSFADMLVATSLHPIMMYYLNQVTSIGPNSRAGRRTGRGYNENLAREILELHSLGVEGGYNQNDVVQLALVLSGWTVARDTGLARFAIAAAEPGPKTVLGKTYSGPEASPEDAETALRDIARHPATARFVATKLARHFVADEPPEQTVAALEKAFIEHDGELMPVYEALVGSEEAWTAFGSKVKSPFDLVISTLRALDPDPAKLADPVPDGPRDNPWTVAGMRSMLQPLWMASQPDGWPDTNAQWLNGLMLTTRLNWLLYAAHQLGRNLDPVTFAKETLGSSASDEMLRVIATAPTREQGIFLALASPAFNRR